MKLIVVPNSDGSDEPEVICESNDIDEINALLQNMLKEYMWPGDYLNIKVVSD